MKQFAFLMILEAALLMISLIFQSMFSGRCCSLNEARIAKSVQLLIFPDHLQFYARILHNV